MRTPTFQSEVRCPAPLKLRSEGWAFASLAPQKQRLRLADEHERYLEGMMEMKRESAAMHADTLEALKVEMAGNAEALKVDMAVKAEARVAEALEQAEVRHMAALKEQASHERFEPPACRHGGRSQIRTPSLLSWNRRTSREFSQTPAWKGTEAFGSLLRQEEKGKATAAWERDAAVSATKADAEAQVADAWGRRDPNAQPPDLESGAQHHLS